MTKTLEEENKDLRQEVHSLNELLNNKNGGEFTVSQAAAYREVCLNRGEQVTCLVCFKTTKDRKRPLKMLTSKFLFPLFHSKKDHEGWVHLGDKPGGGDYGKLLIWGLVECRGQGYWRISENGRRFLNDELALHEYAWVRAPKTFLRWDGRENVKISALFTASELKALRANRKIRKPRVRKKTTKKAKQDA